MQLRAFALVFGTASLAALLPGVGRAESQYHVTLSEPAVVAGVELAAGEYKLVLDGDVVTISKGNQMAKVQVKVGTESQKFSSNAVRYDTGGGKYRVDQIRLGGTKTTLTFPAQGAETAAGGGAAKTKPSRTGRAVKSSSAN